MSIFKPDNDILGGPQFETPAEVNFYHAIGVDALGKNMLNIL
jgi:purine nucleoside phosphorylase